MASSDNEIERHIRSLFFLLTKRHEETTIIKITFRVRKEWEEKRFKISVEGYEDDDERVRSILCFCPFPHDKRNLTMCDDRYVTSGGWYKIYKKKLFLIPLSTCK